ncbi:energy transducer TonB [Rufibacter hautae]|uniref:Energy transducer TonB n=1 Tax=Rufibacter hautae TaxID=2595005 RepID=A0A5B6TIK1_9BACT|nr:energy transducer TonB [Rufibacter hautae]KAA3439277.1 energy transducer TonB [Rufibacter hautae]
METNHAYAATLDDMIFEGRNKAYGAYVLRKLYNQHISQAVLYAIALSLIFFSAPFLANKLLKKAAVVANQSEKKEEGKWVDIKFPPVEEIKEMKGVQPAASKSTGPTVKNTTPKIVEDTKPVTDEIPTQEQLQTASSGLVTSEGNGDGNLNNPEIGAGTGTGPADGNGLEAAPVEQAIFMSVEQMPEFAGGLPKLMEFIGKNLRYPRAAQTSGIEGTVVVSFVVGATGDITDVQVLKGLGYGTEEEAMRVVQKLPRWKPGYQNGRTVPVRMTLPIRLELK